MSNRSHAVAMTILADSSQAGSFCNVFHDLSRAAFASGFEIVFGVGIGFCAMHFAVRHGKHDVGPRSGLCEVFCTLCVSNPVRYEDEILTIFL